MAMPVSDIVARLPTSRRRKIETRAAELIAEEMTLRQLRQARRRTQKMMAKKLKIGQDSVSRLEQRSDLLLSTLRGYVAAMGGSLDLVARFPDRPAVTLSGMGKLADATGARPAKQLRKASRR